MSRLRELPDWWKHQDVERVTCPERGWELSTPPAYLAPMPTWSLLSCTLYHKPVIVSIFLCSLEVPKYSLSVRSTSDNLRFETDVWHEDCLWGWALASVGSAQTLTNFFFISDPCILYSMTNHCVATRQHYTDGQSPATQLYNNRRLTVHLRLLNLGGKKKVFK